MAKGKRTAFIVKEGSQLSPLWVNHMAHNDCADRKHCPGPKNPAYYPQMCNHCAQLADTARTGDFELL